MSDELHSILGVIYDSIADESGWTPALNAVTDSFDSVVSNIFLRPPDKELFLVDTITGADPDSAQAYREISHLDVRWPVSLQNIGKIINDVEVFQNGEYENSLVYNELFRHFQMRYSMTTVLPVTQGLVGGFALMRETSMGGYSLEEVRRLELILPHLSRGLALQRRMLELQARADDLVAALNGLPTAGIILTARRKVICMNRQAEALFANPAIKDGLAISRQHLQARRADDTNRLTEVISLAAQQADGHFLPGSGPVPVITIPRAGHLPLELLAVPLRPRYDIRTETNAHARVLVLIYDPERRPTIDHHLVEGLFDLTSSEAFIAARLAEGLSLKEIAAMRRCSLSTVRTHLKHIFMKTNTSRQGELVQIILTSPALCWDP